MLFGRVRGHEIAAGLLAFGLLIMTGCSSAPASSQAAPSGRPVVTVSAPPSAPPPAALAGGACLLLDYKVINAALGTRFDIDAAADKNGTYTCVVRGDATYPDLTLSITATTLTTADFTADVKPSGSMPVTKLGRVGYVSQIKAGSTGPAIEVGWLSGNDRLIVMRYSADLSAISVGSVGDGMISLARTVDATTV